MNKVREIKIRIVLLYAAWSVYGVLWLEFLQQPLQQLGDLNIIIGYYIPMLAVVIAAVSLGNRLQKEKNKLLYQTKVIPAKLGDFLQSVEEEKKDAA